MQKIRYGEGLYTTTQMIGNVLYSLNKIKVSGKEDLDLLLGSILMLESVKKALDKEEKEKQAITEAIQLREEDGRIVTENVQGS